MPDANRRQIASMANWSSAPAWAYPIAGSK